MRTAVPWIAERHTDHLESTFLVGAFKTTKTARIIFYFSTVKANWGCGHRDHLGLWGISDSLGHPLAVVCLHENKSKAWLGLAVASHYRSLSSVFIFFRDCTPVRIHWAGSPWPPSTREQATFPSCRTLRDDPPSPGTSLTLEDEEENSPF